MADRRNNLFATQHDRGFYQLDEEFNKGVFKVLAGSLRGVVAGAVLSIFLKRRMKAVWIGAGFGGGYGFCEAVHDFNRFQLAERK